MMAFCIFRFLLESFAEIDLALFIHFLFSFFFSLLSFYFALVRLDLLLWLRLSAYRQLDRLIDILVFRLFWLYGFETDQCRLSSPSPGLSCVIVLTLNKWLGAFFKLPVLRLFTIVVAKYISAFGCLLIKH
ncbi:uncharacterized protein BDV17DRAFT_197258 [Aspergillus undulatus]|uniref:uncharacterized protein n=1 Tax=Aspergillus undulatus TaxID=1810928 RepID=UPI003CCCCA61